MIKEVTTFIATKANLTRDTNLFAGHRPQGVTDACDVVIESASGSVFPEIPERADPVFQVLSRAKTYMTARARAWAIYNAIYGDWTLGSAGWTLPKVLSDDSISPCDATDDWTGTFLSIDAADYKEGTGSLKDTIAGPVIDTYYNTYYNPDGSWDWSTRRYILFWLKCDRANTAFTYVWFQVYDTSGNNRTWNLAFSAGEWTAFKLLLSIGDSQSAIPPDLSLIDQIRVHFKTADITPFYKKIDYIRVITDEYEIMVLEPLATPQWIGQDEKGRYEFSTNYIFKIKRL